MTAITTENLFTRTIRRRIARAVLIKDAAAFERLQSELQQALTRAWDSAMRDGIVDALDRLRDLGPGRFTADDGAAILSALEARVGREAIQAAMRQPVINLTDAIFRTGAGEVGRAAGIDIQFMRPDLDALDALKNNNMIWIGETWDSHTKKKLGAVLTEFFENGMTRDGLAQRLADDFKTLTSKSHVYWEMFAEHTATKVREIGRVTGYERAGMEYVQIRAHLDERTTPVCRHLHGRVIAVSTLSEQRDTYLEAGRRGDMDAMKRAWVMHGKAADLSTTPTRDLEGVGSPPYHYRCRTITVAYWPAASDAAMLPAAPSPSNETHEGGRVRMWKEAVYNREKLPRKEVEAIIQRAIGANWANGPRGNVVKTHFQEKAATLGITTIEGYNQSISDTIRRAGREVHLFIREGNLRATFARPYTRMSSKGKKVKGFVITSVDLEANRIVTHHFRQKLGKTVDEVPPQNHGGWGIMKWLTR